MSLVRSPTRPRFQNAHYVSVLTLLIKTESPLADGATRCYKVDTQMKGSLLTKLVRKLKRISLVGFCYAPDSNIAP